MTHASLFSGIGGFDLAAEMAGFTNVFQVENNPWAQKVLAKNFPDVTRYADIKEFNGTPYRGTINLLTGGFPCQPFSTAGKRQGEADDRYLWPEMLRVIREVKPTYVIGENVAGLTSMDSGRTLETICTDLEAEGYTVEPYLVPAAAVGAWHKRERIWIVGYTKHYGQPATQTGRTDTQPQEPAQPIQKRQPKRASSIQSSVTANTNNRVHTRKLDEGRNRAEAEGGKGGNTKERQTHNGQRLWNEPGTGCENATNTKGVRMERNGSTRKQEPQTQIGKELFGCYSTGNGTSYWSIEPSVGRVANGVPNRVDRLKGLGNAIVPQVAYQFMLVIKQLLTPNTHNS